ncbi:Phage tail tube protein [Fibrobacter sp. UWH9]|uniref:phage tail tube protein n=1 Tax=Fibrobacter sp. UWH9 TaxID=1896213 RepID=UPI00091EA67B|nr:phage tail tube protein [Fibrobacter sp. UWH9]SHH24965.1 Phage tail tube protein [Fibrobacter sp. UWH9]
MAEQFDDVGGLYTMYVDGVEFPLKGDPEFDVGGEKRTVVRGKDGKMHGTSLEIVGSKISGTTTNTSELDLAALRSTKGATITLHCPNGKVVSFPNCVFTGDLSVSGAEGEVSFEFSGDVATEIKS